MSRSSGLLSWAQDPGAPWSGEVLSFPLVSPGETSGGAWCLNPEPAAHPQGYWPGSLSSGATLHNTEPFLLLGLSLVTCWSDQGVYLSCTDLGGAGGGREKPDLSGGWCPGHGEPGLPCIWLQTCENIKLIVTFTQSRPNDRTHVILQGKWPQSKRAFHPH